MGEVINMTDFANQGKGSVHALYGTNDHRFLQLVKGRCIVHNVDFWEPGKIKSQILSEAMVLYGMGNQGQGIIREDSTDRGIEI